MLLKEFIKERYYPHRTLKEVLNDDDVGTVISFKGSYSKVYNNKTDPTLIIKIGITAQLANDGYLNYLYRIQNMNSPVVPQIEYIKIFEEVNENKTLTGKYIFKVCMEKLYDASDVDITQGYALLNRYFGKFIDQDRLLKKYVQNESNPISLFIKLLTIIIFKFNRSWLERNYTVFKQFITAKIDDIEDQYLRKLAHLIGRQEKQFDEDLRSDNIMYRMTPYGLQPVITDPFTSRKK